MKKAYERIAKKLGVEETSVELCINNTVNNDMQQLSTNKNLTAADFAVKDIVNFFYCISIEEQI